MKPITIQITVGDSILTATMNDNPTAKEFLSLLPLQLVLEDYNRTEKVSDLPGKLSTEKAPPGYQPSVGDITYYAPWGNLAIFYKGFSYSNGLIALGKIEGDSKALQVSGSLKVTIALAE